ncbi:hypothetical protein NC652_020059 [Populus alba x Populus x berolinensis]|nr:hypothetical protein NC652_020059 [Populus alba x Populus x berolinensis]
MDILVNLHLAMEIIQWNWVFYAVIWGSIAATSICVMILNAIPMFVGYCKNQPLKTNSSKKFSKAELSSVDKQPITRSKIAECASVDGDDCIKELFERIDPGKGLGVEIREFDVKIAVEQARIESQALSIDVISLDVAVQYPGRVAVHLSCRETNVLNMSGKGNR